MTDLAVLLAVLAATAAAAWWWRRSDGAVRGARHGDRLTPADLAALGAAPGDVVLLEFTAPGCITCRATRRVLEDVADGHDDVTVAVADVGEHLELARVHRVLRAPTTLVVGRDGAVRHRILGVPAAQEVATLLEGATAQQAA